MYSSWACGIEHSLVKCVAASALQVSHTDKVVEAPASNGAAALEEEAAPVDTEAAEPAAQES